MPMSPRQTAVINTQPGIEMPSNVQSTLAALPAAGHHFADDFEQREHLQQVVERRAAGGHRAGRLMLNPHVAAPRPRWPQPPRGRSIRRRRWRRRTARDAGRRRGIPAQARRYRRAGTCTADRAKAQDFFGVKDGVTQHAAADERAREIDFLSSVNMAPALYRETASPPPRPCNRRGRDPLARQDSAG